MVDLTDIESVGPGDEVDGTKHLFGKIRTMSRIFYMGGLQNAGFGGRQN